MRLRLGMADWKTWFGAEKGMTFCGDNPPNVQVEEGAQDLASMERETGAGVISIGRVRGEDTPADRADTSEMPSSANTLGRTSWGIGIMRI